MYNLNIRQRWQQDEQGESGGDNQPQEQNRRSHPLQLQHNLRVAAMQGDGGMRMAAEFIENRGGASTHVIDESSVHRPKSRETIRMEAAAVGSGQQPQQGQHSSIKEQNSSSQERSGPSRNTAPFKEDKKRPYEEDKDHLSTLSSSDGQSKNSSLPGSNAAKHSKKQKQSRKAPTDPNATPKPKRPMSAYNYFFREERARILEASRESTNGVDAALIGIDNHVPFNSLTDQDTLAPEMSGIASSLASSPVDGAGISTASSRKNKRPPPHGKVTFENLGKMIASRWKAIGATALEPYTRLAKVDGARYRRELSEYYEKESDRRRDVFFPGMEGAFVGTVISAATAKPLVIDVNQSSSTSTANKNSKQDFLASGAKGGAWDGKPFSRNGNESALNVTASQNVSQVTSSVVHTVPAGCFSAGFNPNLQNNNQEQSAASLPQNASNVIVQAQYCPPLPQMQLMNMLVSLMNSAPQAQAQNFQHQQQVGGAGLSFPSVPQIVPPSARPSTVGSSLGAQFHNQGGAGHNDLLGTLLRTLQPGCPPQQQQQFPSPGTTSSVGPGLHPPPETSQLSLQLLQQVLSLQQQQQGNAGNVNMAALLVLAGGAMLQGGNQQHIQSQHQPQYVPSMPPIVAAQRPEPNTNSRGLNGSSLSTPTVGLGQQQQQPDLSALLLPLAFMLQQQNNSNSFQNR
jgi:hypothetical protein